MRQEIVIAARYQGPPGMGNGGYVCGLLAARADAPVQVTLRRPAPLDSALAVSRADDGRVLLHDGDALVAEAAPCRPEPDLDALDVPPPPTWAQAEAATRRYPGLQSSAAANCFVCGPQRQAGDGLRVFPGWVDRPVPPEGRAIVAAPWVPDASLAGAGGRVRAELLWAVLDCPGAWAVHPPRPMLLGRMSARLLAPVRPGQRCLVIGWPLGRERRKHFMGTALFTEAGQLLGMARATWIQPRSNIEP